ncbi:MAG: hypothetical protein NTZ24_04295 [Deltaproteobacteria bacterium]|nr:hypothetical protein [Deltaproteobacteria bacterium]
MNTRDGLKVTFFVILLMTMTILPEQAFGMAFDWKRFQTRSDLILYAPSAMPEKIGLLPTDDLSSIRDVFKEEGGGGPDLKSDENPGIFKYRKIKLYLSSLVMDQRNIDVHQLVDNGSGKFIAVKSLPSMFLNFQYRDTFESIGRIFEPQLNLGIEF